MAVVVTLGADEEPLRQLAASPVASEDSLRGTKSTVTFSRGWETLKNDLGCSIVTAFILPGVDQVLGQTDAGVRASDGDLSVGGAFHGVGDLDLSPRHLADLVDLCTLATNDAADELGEEKQMTRTRNDRRKKKKKIRLEVQSS